MVDINLAAATDAGLIQSCAEISFKQSTEFSDVHDFDKAVEISSGLDEPVIFRKFNRDAGLIWTDVATKHKDDKFLLPEITLESFGNLMMPGTRTNVLAVQNVSIEGIIRPPPHLANKSYYGAFVPFLTRETLSTVINGPIPDWFHIDTNFISNFAEDVVATPLHSTTYALSFSVQLLGKKLWIWRSPAEMEALGTISSHSANFYTGGSEKDFGKVYILLTCYAPSYTLLMCACLST